MHAQGTVTDIVLKQNYAPVAVVADRLRLVAVPRVEDCSAGETVEM